MSAKHPTYLLQRRIFWPGPHWHWVVECLDIRKASFPQHPRHLGDDIEFDPHPFTNALEFIQESPHRAIGRERVVIAEEVCTPFCDLNLAAGFEVYVALLQEGGPGTDRATECPPVDEIKAIGRESPLLRSVVDIELYVGRHPHRLDRAEVRPYHHCGRAHIAHFNSPDTGTRSNI